MIRNSKLSQLKILGFAAARITAFLRDAVDKFDRNKCGQRVILWSDFFRLRV